MRPGVDLSIIIVNWNSTDYLRRCLQSVSTQTSDVRYETIVLDAGSFDGCGEMLRDEFPLVRFIQTRENLGFARSNNLAFEASAGENLLFLNPDTEVTGRAVDVLVEHVRRLPDAGVIGARLLNPDGTVQTSCVQSFPTVANQLLDAELLRRWRPRSPLWGNAALLDPGSGPQEVDAVSGACLVVSRRVFELVGRFSEDYFMYAEDLDLAFRAKRAGRRTYHVPAAVIVHHGGASSGRAGSAFSAVMLREANFTFLRKTRGPLYGGAYRGSMLAASMARLALLVPVAAAWRRGARAESLRLSIRKWRAVAWWSLQRDGALEGCRPEQGALPGCPRPGHADP